GLLEACRAVRVISGARAECMPVTTLLAGPQTASKGVMRLTTGSWPPMPPVARRTLAPLAVVTAAAFVFALLLILVRLQWAPLESADHGAAAGLNSLVARHAAVVSFVKAVTW